MCSVPEVAAASAMSPLALHRGAGAENTRPSLPISVIVPFPLFTTCPPLPSGRRNDWMPLVSVVIVACPRSVGTLTGGVAWIDGGPGDGAGVNDDIGAPGATDPCAGGD